jgi:hypothetical protein
MMIFMANFKELKETKNFRLIYSYVDKIGVNVSIYLSYLNSMSRLAIKINWQVALEAILLVNSKNSLAINIYLSLNL